MKTWRLVFALAVAAAGPVSAAGTKAAACPPGEPIQWIADYCMAQIGTDDEIAASECISKEHRRAFRSACGAKLHFKRALCEIVVASQARSGTVKACVDDRTFSGPTVRNGGVGG